METPRDFGKPFILAGITQRRGLHGQASYITLWDQLVAVLFYLHCLI